MPPSTLPGLGPSAARTVVDAGQLPWRAIVRVQTEIGMRCTGALVGPRQVLTAAHCLFGRGTGRLVRPASIHVLAGYDHGDYTGHARAVAVRVGAGFAVGPDGQRLPTSSPDADWALLTLDTALGTPDRVLAIIRQLPPIGTPVMLGGFEQDRAQVLVADLACSIGAVIRDGSATLLRHSCAGTRGVSGAPLLARLPDQGGPNQGGQNQGGQNQGWGVIGIASIAIIGTAGGYAVPMTVIPSPLD